MDTEALPAALQGPLVARAFEELKMLTQTDLERERYESRRKALLDDMTRLKVARLEGIEEGRTEEKKSGMIGTIHFCERLLNRPETPTVQLAPLSADELTRLAEDLKQEVLKK